MNRHRGRRLTSPWAGRMIAGLVICAATCAALAQARSTSERQVELPGSPFGVAMTPDDRWAFSSLTGSTNGIAILHRNEGKAYQLMGAVATAGKPFGLAISRDGKLLLAAVQPQGVGFIDVARAIAGSQDAVRGYVSLGDAAGTIGVTLSHDERFIFATNENSGSVSVIDVAKAFASNFAASADIGEIPVEHAPVGLALSRDGAQLFVTNEIAKAGTPGYDPSACNIPIGLGGLTRPGPQGTITVIDVRRAEVDPATAVVSRAYAGCVPVRIQLSHKGDVAWVTARASDRIEAFDARRLLTDPVNALIASTSVGAAPVGLQLFAGDRLVAVANSNRFGGGAGTVSIVDVERALHHEPATLTTISVGNFPREWALSRDGSQLLLTEYSSSTLDIFDVTALVRGIGASRPESSKH